VGGESGLGWDRDVILLGFCKVGSESTASSHNTTSACSMGGNWFLKFSLSNSNLFGARITISVVFSSCLSRHLARSLVEKVRFLVTTCFQIWLKY
jgi:hypothetical protein